MPKPSPAVVASHLEKLPLELFEPILENLSFRDVIALAKHAGDDSRLAAALETSPRWRDMWPTYVAHREDFQTLASLIVPVGGNKLFDPTGGALDVTPGQFQRRLVRERAFHGPDHDFFRHAAGQASRTIQRLLETADRVTVAFLCQRIPLDDIAVICPWLKNLVVVAQQRHPSARGESMRVVRDKFHEVLSSEACACRPGLAPATARTNRWSFASRSASARRCQVKHPDRRTAEWTVPQMKAFVGAYSVLQTQLNATKAEQLRTLAGLYARHHSRLKEPYAPQSPRGNIRHIPDQLEVVSRFVLRIIDLDRECQPRSKQGMSKFRYLHPCLVPYDWCLRLWLRVSATNPHLQGDFWSALLPLEKSLEDYMKALSLSPGAQPEPEPEPRQPPSEIVSQIRVVNQGIKTFYKRSRIWGQENAAMERTRTSSDGSLHFKPQPDSGLVMENRIGGGRLTMLPPVHTREMEWLVAFVGVVEWMEDTYPDLAASEEMMAAKLCKP